MPWTGRERRASLPLKGCAHAGLLLVFFCGLVYYLEFSFLFQISVLPSILLCHTTSHKLKALPGGDLHFALAAVLFCRDACRCLASQHLRNRFSVFGEVICVEARSVPLTAVLGSANQTQPPRALDGELVMSRSRNSGDFGGGRGTTCKHPHSKASRDTGSS